MRGTIQIGDKRSKRVLPNEIKNEAYQKFLNSSLLNIVNQRRKS